MQVFLLHFITEDIILRDAVLPDQIDPLEELLYPSSEALASKGRTVFDIGAGFLFISGKFFAGISVNHLAEPDLQEQDL